MKLCKVDDCDKIVRTKGFCNAHHLMWLRHGDPLAGKFSHGSRIKFINKLKTIDTNDCIVWPFGLNPKGYGVGFIDGKQTSAQRQICFEIYGPPPTQDFEAAHSCGKGHEGCCNPKHLRWATKEENQADRIIHGTSNRGIRNGSHKLNENEVLEIIDLLRSGMNDYEIAPLFSVTREAIRNIRTGRCWGWLKGYSKKLG